MKSLNVKITLKTADKLSDNAHLNPQYLIEFIEAYKASSVHNEGLEGITFNYTFKAPDDLHREVKLLAARKGLPLNEMLGRLLEQYYKGWGHE